MDLIKKNLWQSKESNLILLEVVLFAAQVIAVIFILSSSLDRYSDDTVVKFSRITTSVKQE